MCLEDYEGRNIQKHCEMELKCSPRWLQMIFLHVFIFALIPRLRRCFDVNSCHAFLIRFVGGACYKAECDCVMFQLGISISQKMLPFHRCLQMSFSLLALISHAFIKQLVNILLKLSQNIWLFQDKAGSVMKNYFFRCNCTNNFVSCPDQNLVWSWTPTSM